MDISTARGLPKNNKMKGFFPMEYDVSILGPPRKDGQLYVPHDQSGQIVYDPSILDKPPGADGEHYDPSILGPEPADAGGQIYTPPEERKPEATLGRIAGRFWNTIKSTPAEIAAYQRAELQADNPEDLKNRPYAAPDPYHAMQINRRMMDAANRGETWNPTKTAVDSTYERMNPAEKARVDADALRRQDDGYHPDTAHQDAVIAEVERKKQDRIKDLQRVEKDFTMPGEYQKSSGFLEDLAGGLATTATALPAFMLNPAIGGLMMYEQLGGAKVQQLEAAGLTDPQRIIKAARVSAGFQTPIMSMGDMIMLSRILKPLGKWTSSLVHVAESMVGQGAAQFVSRYPDEFATMMAMNPDLSDRELWNAFYKRLPEISGQATYAGLVGAATGALIAGTGVTSHYALNRLLTPKQRIINDTKYDRITQLVNQAREGTITDQGMAQLKGMLNIPDKVDVSADALVSDVEQRIKIAAPIQSENRTKILGDMTTAMGEEQARPVIDLMDGVARAWARRNDADPAAFYQDVLGGFMKGESGAFLKGQNKALLQGPRTLRGRIEEAGGIDFLHFKGERKELPDEAKRLSRKDGVPIDVLEQTLKNEGWLEPGEDLLSVLRDPSKLSRQNRNADFAASDLEGESPPEAEYKTAAVQDLPEGEPLAVISDSLPNGWAMIDRVDKSDPFETKLIGDHGETILSPTDQVDYAPISARDQTVNPNAPRGAISNLFSDLPKVIHAFESADPSTPIHEMGHLLTGMLAKERSEDYRTLAEWAGVEPDRASAGLEGWKDAELEKVARAFEAYVMEGKSPTLRLRDVFKKMRDWLIDVYKSIRALDVNLTDNVRGVFDRLLAADFERQDDLAAEVNEWLNVGELGDGSDFNYFAATPKDIDREAIRRVAKKGAKERKKRDKELRASFKKRAQETVGEYPYFKMMAEARDRGLSIDALKAAFDADTVKAMMKKAPGVVRAGGEDPIQFAAEHGYMNLETLVDDILGSPTKAEAIQEHFDSLWNEYRKGQAVENADLYIRALDEQQKIIAEMTGEAPQKTMQDIIGERGGAVSEEEFKKLVHDFKRDRQIAENAYNYGLEAGKDARKQKLQKLQQTVEKQRQRLAKIRDTQKARADREMIARRMRRIWKSKSIPPEYRAQITHFLSEYYDIPQTFLIPPDEPLEAFLERKYEDNSWVVDSIRGELAHRPVQDRNAKTGYRIPLTPEQREVVANVADMLAHMGRTEGKLLKEGNAQDLLNTVMEMAQPMIEAHGEPKEGWDQPRVPSARRLSWWQKMSDFAKRYIAELRRAEFIFRAADGWKDFGPNWKNLFLPIKKAEDAELTLGDQIMRKIKASFDKIKADQKWALKKYQIEGIGDRMTKEEMIMVALNSGNDGNLAALREGFGWTDEQIVNILDKLSPEEVNLVDEIWKTIDSLYPYLDHVHRQITGVSLPKVEGRYFPLVFDKDIAWRAGQFAEEARKKDLFATAYTRPSVQAGHRIARTGGKMAPHLSFSVIARHIVGAVHDATHQLPVRNAQQIIANPIYRGAVISTMGDATYRQLMPWLQDVASPRREPATQVDKWVGRIRKNATIVSLGLKFSVATKQFLSYTQTMDELGAGPALSGLAQFFARPHEMAEFIKESSPMMAHRKMQWDRELNQFAASFDPSVKPGFEKAKEAFFWMIGTMDAAATYPTWLAGYRVGMERFNGDHAKAVELADQTVRRTQPVASPKDMSTMQRGGETRSELRKLFTMFYTFFSSFQNRMQEVSQRLRLGDMNMTQAIRSYWYLLVLPSIVSTAIAERKWPWDSGIKKYAKGLAGYWAAQFPFIRDLVNPFLSGFDYTLTPVESGMRTISSLPVVLTAKNPNPRTIRHQIIGTAGYTVGLPSSQMNITMDGIIDLMQDKTDNPWRLIYSEQREKKRELY